MGNSISYTVPDGYCTKHEVAKRIGRSIDTIRRWEATGVFTPSKFIQNGKVQTWIYSEKDIKELKRLAKEMKPGRPHKE